MPFVTTYDEALNILDVKYTGTVTGADLRSGTTEAISLQKRLGVTRFLVCLETDDTHATSIKDIYDLPTKQYWEEKLDPRSRIAVIRPAAKRARELAEFFENLCRGRSWHVEMFSDRQLAIGWLTNDSREP
jgi:hypothetical protein